MNPGIIVPPPFPIRKRERKRQTDTHTEGGGEKRVGYGNSIDLVGTKD